MFIEPMLADTAKPDQVLTGGQWVAEEKWDGHRLIVEVVEGAEDLFSPPRTVRAWSRDANPRILPKHVTAALAQFPPGIYDGELLVPGKRSYGVTELTNASELCYVVFDVLQLMGENVMDVAYTHRRNLLVELFARLNAGTAVRLSDAQPIASFAEALRLCNEVWARDGEGLILKRCDSLYRPNKRSKDWLKIKALRSTVVTVTGYEYGKLGPYAKVTVVDSEGNTTVVKTRNTLERERLAANPDAFIGRQLRIDYQERTPDGSYRHPRWDRFEDE